MKRMIKQSLILLMVILSLQAAAQKVSPEEALESDTIPEWFDKEYGIRYYHIDPKQIKFPRLKPKPEKPTIRYYPSPLKIRVKRVDFGVLA